MDFSIDTDTIEVEPSNELIARLQSASPVATEQSIPQVHPISKCAVKPDIFYMGDDSFVTDAATGAPGVIFDVGFIKWIGRGEVWVTASRFIHPINAEGWICSVTNDQGAWSVSHCDMVWIS